MSTLQLTARNENPTGLPMINRSRIIVADDDENLCIILRETLRDAGYEVMVANDGDQLVRMAQEHAPDLLLVDLMMPTMDGFEAIRQLRNDTRTGHLPMLILTARSASAEVVTGFDTGADDYIVKPYDIDVLLARIRGHLRRAAQLPPRNPLTGLPGNVLLQAELDRLIGGSQPFSLLYIDLDNFKAFNDVYGFARGDRAIHLVANLIAQASPPEDFIGHIGGDDFAIIHFADNVEQFCQQVIAAFDQQVRTLYDESDLARGFLQAYDRHGVLRRFGFLSLSIAAVNTRTRPFANVDEMSKVAAELKQVAKQTSGSSYQIDRRQTKLLPLYERRGRKGPAALLIHPDKVWRSSIATTLQLQGYRPLIAGDVLAAQTLLARAPAVSLVVASTATGQTLWDMLRQLAAPAALIALATYERDAQEARAHGADAVIIEGDDLIDFTDRLLTYLPLVERGDSVPKELQASDVIIRQLQERADQLERAANEDALTELLNRRSFDEQFQQAFVQAATNGQPLCIMMADIDHFKQINDRYSHRVGDQVLKTVAHLLRSTARESDIVARYGGEEFVIALPNTDLQGAVTVAERIRQAIKSHDWSKIDAQCSVTISVGVTDNNALNAEQALHEADLLLYRAKRGGRDRVVGRG
jgi:diguanylate cyclase (GGDEF)-like protein